MDLEDFAIEAEAVGAVVFIALHGGLGEDGRLQDFLQEHNVRFTGSSGPASQLCMDKVRIFKLELLNLKLSDDYRYNCGLQFHSCTRGTLSICTFDQVSV